MATNGHTNGASDGSPRLKIPDNREFKGGDLLAQTLKHLGAECAFGLHGGHLDAFLQGATEARIRLIDTRHEAAAVNAAEGYSKMKRTVGVCFVTANSGFSNGIAGLATAFADRSSIMCITASSPMRDMETNVLQGFHDQVVLSKPITRFAHRVSCVEEIPRLVSHAWRVSRASPPGPVVLDFPIEILFSPVQLRHIRWGSTFSPQVYPSAPAPEAVRKAVEMIKAAKHPAIFSGTGARALEGDTVFQSFIERVNIPVFHSPKLTSPLPFDHPLRGGVIGLLAALPKQAQPDLIMILGARNGMYTGSRSASVLPKSDVCKYIQIDMDASEIGRSIEIDLGIASDTREAVSVFHEAFEGWKISEAMKEWAKTAVSIRKAEQPEEKDSEEPSPGAVHPYHALKSTFASLPEGSIIVIDGGECGSWATQTQEFARAYAVVFAPGYLGMLGNGWGYALGIAVAEPSRLVVSVHGDGSGGFHIAELDSYVRHNCRIMTVLYNNHCWGMSINGQDLIYGNKVVPRPVSKLTATVSYAGVAENFGCKSRKASSVKDIKEAVAEFTKDGSASLLEVITSRHPTHPGTVAMVGQSEDEDVVVIPYYDNVPRAFYKNASHR